jgi:hypothetical protein
LTRIPDDPAALLALLEPSPDALLGVLRQRVDDAMLREIAAADYGRDIDRHLRELRAIRDRGAVPAPMDWWPQEVLELTRWSEPGKPTGAVDPALREHLKRAFSCGVLLRAGAEPANADSNLFSESDTLAQLLDSVLVLGDEAQRAALRFLAWRVQGLPECESERSFFALAVALLGVHLRGEPSDAGWLGQLGWWVLAVAEQDEPWSPLLAYGGLLYGVWQTLARGMREEVETLPPGETREVLSEVAGLIVR